jgi:crotonobetainyl-CoA:carnitine CoA-transferase CaiB-like acyl-CoA transferase
VAAGTRNSILYASVNDGAHPDAPRPLDGVRILALEQMQALPFATQLLARLGADVVKVEPLTGELGRGALPAIEDPAGRRVGCTFLRNNFGKRSVAIDLKNPAGRDLVLKLAPRFDIVAENSKPGAMQRLGLDYEAMKAVHPSVIYASVSGFGNMGDSPYRSWPAFAPIVEGMSGIYEMKREDDHPPLASPVGALGDISAAVFCVIGMLAALRHRDLTGEGQYVDIAMFDSVIAFTDIVMNFWSMGLTGGNSGPVINHGFRAADGWFIMQVAREEHFGRLMRVVGHPEWATDPRLAERSGWVEHLDDVIRPGVEGWAADKSRAEVCQILSGEGVAAGPCLREEELVTDPHVKSRNMVSAIERPDGSGPPVLAPGNPVKMSAVPDDGDRPIPWLGQHTDGVLEAELGLSPVDLGHLRTDGVIG